MPRTLMKLFCPAFWIRGAFSCWILSSPAVKNGCEGWWRRPVKKARLLEKAAEKGVAAVVSRHDFSGTPPEEEIFHTLESMKKLGADLPKMAVMPKSPQDVLTLLSATLRAREQLGPVITMSMGSLGKLSRVSGAVFGSCLTFAAGQSSSAPGQINAEDLKAILEDLDPAEFI